MRPPKKTWPPTRRGSRKLQHQLAVHSVDRCLQKGMSGRRRKTTKTTTQAAKKKKKVTPDAGYAGFSKAYRFCKRTPSLPPLPLSTAFQPVCLRSRLEVAHRLLLALPTRTKVSPSDCWDSPSCTLSFPCCMLYPQLLLVLLCSLPSSSAVYPACSSWRRRRPSSSFHSCSVRPICPNHCSASQSAVCRLAADPPAAAVGNCSGMRRCPAAQPATLRHRPAWWCRCLARGRARAPAVAQRASPHPSGAGQLSASLLLPRPVRPTVPLTSQTCPLSRPCHAPPLVSPPQGYYPLVPSLQHRANHTR